MDKNEFRELVISHLKNIEALIAGTMLAVWILFVVYIIFEVF